MKRQWKFETYPQPEQTIRGIIQEREKGVHISGAEIHFMGVLRGRSFFLYKFKERNLNLYALAVEIGVGDLDTEIPENWARLGPECKVGMRDMITAENVLEFDQESIQHFVTHILSFLAEFHHSHVSLRLPEDNDHMIKRKIKIHKMCFQSRVVTAFKLNKEVYEIGGEIE